MHCVFRPLAGATKTLVHFHGNGETAADYDPDFVALMHSMGLSVFLCEYRGYGGSTGRPMMAKMLEDTDKIFQHLGIPSQDLIVFGRSVGSIYAVEFARRHPEIAGLVIESGIADPLERVLLRAHPAELGTNLDTMIDEAALLFNHASVMNKFSGALLIMHAVRDHIVNVDHARRLHDWAGSDQKRLVLFPRGDHNSIFGANLEQYILELRSFIAGLDVQ